MIRKAFAVLIIQMSQSCQHKNDRARPPDWANGERFSSKWSRRLSGVCQCQGRMDRIISCASRVSWLETPQSIDLSVITQAVLASEKLHPEVLSLENRIKYMCRTEVRKERWCWEALWEKRKIRQILTHVVCHLQWWPEARGNTKTTKRHGWIF